MLLSKPPARDTGKLTNITGAKTLQEEIDRIFGHENASARASGNFAAAFLEKATGKAQETPANEEEICPLIPDGNVNAGNSVQTRSVRAKRCLHGWCPRMGASENQAHLLGRC